MAGRINDPSLLPRLNRSSASPISLTFNLPFGISLLLSVATTATERVDPKRTRDVGGSRALSRADNLKTKRAARLAAAVDTKKRRMKRIWVDGLGAGEGFERLIHRRSELRSELDQSIIYACPSVRILEQNRLYRFADSQFGGRVSLSSAGITLTRLVMEAERAHDKEIGLRKARDR